jgi:peroxidase
VLLPENLSEDDIRDKLAGARGPGDPLATDDREARSHRLFTKARREDKDIREAALRLLQIVDEFEAEGISLRSGNDGFDSHNSVDVEDICPWTGSRRPRCGALESRWRTVDGSCNNLEAPLWGMASTPQQRILEPASYSQPGSRPRVASSGGPLPSARLVSTTAFTSGDSPNTRKISTLFMQMGQFIDHDLTHSPATAPPDSCCLNNRFGQAWLYPSRRQMDGHPECFPIEIPRDDPFWSRQGRTCMTFSRTDPSPPIPKCSSQAGRQPTNAISHWLDASNVYGSTSKETTEVRDTQDRLGFLKTSRSRSHLGRDLLPQCAREVSADIEACGEICEEDKSRKCTFAGDFRVNEQPGLTTMHTLWVREHNRIASRLSQLNTHWDMERVFQETRRIVVAVWQNIVYNEWLPIVLGQQYMDSFNLFPLKPGQGYTEDYDSSIDPRINAEFSGAAFRFGHSMVPGMMEVMNTNGSRVEQMRLKNVFNDPSRLQERGFADGVLLGQSLGKAPAWDPQFSEDLLNHLFETDREGGLDLASLNIQRGRDLGLGGYNEYRAICASGKYRHVQSFEDFDRDGYLSAEAIRKLQSLYDDVADIDLFVGGMLEASHQEALLGPTFLCIIGDQFLRLKSADRFWFENGNDIKSRFSLGQLDSLRSSSMARIMCDNSDMKQVQPFAFWRAFSPVNDRIDCQDIDIPQVNLDLWVEQ